MDVSCCTHTSENYHMWLGRSIGVGIPAINIERARVVWHGEYQLSAYGSYIFIKLGSWQHIYDCHWKMVFLRKIILTLVIPFPDTHCVVHSHHAKNSYSMPYPLAISSDETEFILAGGWVYVKLYPALNVPHHIQSIFGYSLGRPFDSIKCFLCINI